MSFIDQILEEKEYHQELDSLYEEMVELEKTLGNLKEKAKLLKEDVMDFPNATSVGEVFDEAQERLKTAKWAFGLTNKLKNPEDRKKHRRNIIIVMNKLRALVNRLIKRLTVETEDDAITDRPTPNDSRTPARAGQGRQVTSTRSQDSYGRNTGGNSNRPGFMT